MPLLVPLLLLTLLLPLVLLLEKGTIGVRLEPQVRYRGSGERSLLPRALGGHVGVLRHRRRRPRQRVAPRPKKARSRRSSGALQLQRGVSRAGERLGEDRAHFLHLCFFFLSRAYFWCCIAPSLSVVWGRSGPVQCIPRVSFFTSLPRPSSLRPSVFLP